MSAEIKECQNKGQVMGAIQEENQEFEAPLKPPEQTAQEVKWVENDKKPAQGQVQANIRNKVLKTYLPSTPEKFKEFKPRSQEIAETKNKISSEKKKNGSSSKKENGNKNIQQKSGVNVDTYSTYVNASEEHSQISDFEVSNLSKTDPARFDIKNKIYNPGQGISEHQEEDEISAPNASGKKGNAQKNTSEKRKVPKNSSVVDKLISKKKKKPESVKRPENTNSEKTQKEGEQPVNQYKALIDANTVYLEDIEKKDEKDEEVDKRIILIVRRDQLCGEIQGFLLSTPENELYNMKDEFSALAKELNAKTFQSLKLLVRPHSHVMAGMSSLLVLFKGILEEEIVKEISTEYIDWKKIKPFIINPASLIKCVSSFANLVNENKIEDENSILASILLAKSQALAEEEKSHSTVESTINKISKFTTCAINYHRKHRLEKLREEIKTSLDELKEKESFDESYLEESRTRIFKFIDKYFEVQRNFEEKILKIKELEVSSKPDNQQAASVSKYRSKTPTNVVYKIGKNDHNRLMESLKVETERLATLNMNKSTEIGKTVTPGELTSQQKKEIESEIDNMKKDIHRMENENSRILWEIGRASPVYKKKKKQDRDEEINNMKKEMEIKLTEDKKFKESVEKQAKRDKEIAARKKKQELEEIRNIKKSQQQQSISEIQAEYRKTVEEHNWKIQQEIMSKESRKQGILDKKEEISQLKSMRDTSRVESTPASPPQNNLKEAVNLTEEHRELMKQREQLYKHLQRNKQIHTSVLKK